MSANANELYNEMAQDIESNLIQRQVGGSSPAQCVMYEALPGRSYVLRSPCFNVIGGYPLHVPWAIANVLHFFADTEEAGCLRRYNKHADRFLTGDKWIGAYGYQIIDGIRACIELLRVDPDSRRAVACMSGLEWLRDELDINVPACWTAWHFQKQRGVLDLLVYQRSLSLKVMPYDCILLTNILEFVTQATNQAIGSLRWFVGNLHTPELTIAKPNGERNRSLMLPYEVLSNPFSCSRALDCEEGILPEPYWSLLREGITS